MKNQIIKGIITGIQPYGVFVSFLEYSGLVHISELSDEYVSDIKEYVDIGDELKFLVLEVNEVERTFKLSYKQLHPINPRVRRKYRVSKGFISLERQLPKWLKKEE